jgi:hypothetical protein
LVGAHSVLARQASGDGVELGQAVRRATSMILIGSKEGVQTSFVVVMISEKRGH